MLGDIPIIRKELDTSKQEAINAKLRRMHDTVLGDIERNDAAFDIYVRNTDGDDLVMRSTTFLAQDQVLRDKTGGPSIKREKFHTSYWNKWNSDKNILEGESAREQFQRKREDPDLVKLNRKKLAHKKMMETRMLAYKEFRPKRVQCHTFDAPGKGGTFELPPIGQVQNVNHDQVFVEYVFRNCLIDDNPKKGHQTEKENLGHSLPAAALQNESSMQSKDSEKNEENVRTTINPQVDVAVSDDDKRPNSRTATFTTKGGALSMAPRHLGDKICTDTAGCDIPPLPSSLAKAEETRFVNTFGSASRFPAVSSQLATSNTTVSFDKDPATMKLELNAGHTFSVALRFQEVKDTAKDTPVIQNAPGPGYYSVPRLFDPPVNPLTKVESKKLTEAYETFELLREKQDIQRHVRYGFHCNAHDHVRFGMCGVPGTMSSSPANWGNVTDNSAHSVHTTGSSDGTTLLPSMCHCCHHTHYDTRRMRDPEIVAAAKQKIEEEKLAEARALREAEEAEDLLLGRHLRQLYVTSNEKYNKNEPSDESTQQKEEEGEEQGEGGGEEEESTERENARGEQETGRRSEKSKEVQDIFEEQVSMDSKVALSTKLSTKSTQQKKTSSHQQSGIKENTSTTASSSSSSTSLMNRTTGGATSSSSGGVYTGRLSASVSDRTDKHLQPLQRDVTQYYSKKKKREIQQAKRARAQAIQRVREEDEFLAAVDAEGLIPRPLYELTALMTAALKEDIEAIRIMAQNFSNPNIRQPETLQTALHHAAHANKPRSAQAILHYFHADYQIKYRKFTTDDIHRFSLQVNLRDHQGDTALHIACRKGHLEVVKVLTEDVRCRPAIPPTSQAQDRLDWLNFIVSGTKLAKGDDPAAENQRNQRGEFETDLCFKFHNRTVGHLMWQCVNQAIDRKRQEHERQQENHSQQLEKKKTTDSGLSLSENSLALDGSLSVTKSLPVSSVSALSSSRISGK